MLARNKRSIPIPSIRRLFVSALWLNRGLLTRLLVESNQPSVLCLCINDVRIVWICSAFKTIATIGHKPIAVNDSTRVDGLRRSTQAIVVLSSAVNVVERPIVIDGYTVKLDRRNICLPIPAAHPIPSFIQTAVRTNVHVVRVRRINPQTVVVHMLESLRNAVERFTPVRAHLRVGIHAVHGVFIRWVANEFYVVVSRSFMARFLAPARPTIFRCVSTVPFNGRVQLIWIRWRNIHPNTAHISTR